METPVVLAFTPNYIVPACTTIQSILLNSGDCHFHIICLLTEDLSEELKKAIEQLGSSRLRFSFINLNGFLKGVYVDDRYTVAASFRLLLPNILPNYDKVIYTDCDIVFQNNLAEIFDNVELEDNYIAGVFESPLEFQKPYLDQIGSEPGYYMNSGFMIMNLHLMREDNLVPQFIEALKVDYLQFPDQDVLNIVCKNKIKGLPPYMNSIRTFYVPTYKLNFLQRYSQDDYEDVLNKGNIHYTGGKPWNEFTLKFDSWWYYKRQLPMELKNMLKSPIGIRILINLIRIYPIGALISKFRSIYQLKSNIL